VEENGDLLSRRKFLGTLSAVAGSLAGIMITIVAVGFLYPVPRRGARPLFACLESEFPPGQVREIKDPRGHKVLLMRRSSGEIVAFATVCTHLGCAVYYRPEEERFDCPCHQGVFDANGFPISGPPRTPLPRYPTEVREGKVFIQFG